MLALLQGCGPVNDQKQTNAWQTASGTPVEKGTPINFPADHGKHQKQGIEWWYVTANLTSESGETFGLQWTLFRALTPGGITSVWWDNNIYFSHFAMQNNQVHVAFERYGRAQQVEISAMPFKAAIDDWHLSSQENTFLPLRLSAKQDDYQVALNLDNSPLTLHGDDGYSQKTPSGHASMYYSYPFLAVTGKLTFAGQHYKVSGHAWLDREWSASLLDRNQMGWDWFSFVDNSRADEPQGLMVFCIRNQKQLYDYCSGSQVAKDGTATQLLNQSIELKVLDYVNLGNKNYPSKWQLAIEDKQDIIIETITRDSRNQLSIPYWEGRVTASGGFNGLGYAELVGY